MKPYKEFKRKIFSCLVEWKASGDRKALLLKGARQIGKTTIVRRFGKENYKNFVEINFEQSPLAKQAFEGNLDAKTIIMNLSAMGYGPFEKGNTLVFFDEIQSCPKARTAIKFLIEDGSFDYIESGSLLGINYKDISSFPVGYEQQLDMYPMDFEEFLWACRVSTDVIDVLRYSYENISTVPEFLHEQIMLHFRKYLIVGGMPEVVYTFVENGDITKVTQIQSNILGGYRNDIAKYADKDKVLAKRVFDSIPEQLCKKDKRFVLADLEKGASQRKYGDATVWLVDAGIVYFSFNVSALELPLAFSERRNLYKLFMLDTGLLCSLSLPTMQFEVLNGTIDINEGALTENFVASEMIKRGKSLYYYDKKSKQELDFIFLDNNKISIIEVKSGRDFKRHASLDAAIANKGNNIGRSMVFSRFNVEQNNSIIYYPLYMTMFL
jgi:predicted AAA+ superfamily ATPase